MIDVGRRELTGNDGRNVFLCRAGVAASRDYRGVVGAGHIDGHGLSGDAAEEVGVLDGERVSNRLARRQGLDVRGVVVERVDPVTGLIEREARHSQ